MCVCVCVCVCALVEYVPACVYVEFGCVCVCVCVCVVWLICVSGLYVCVLVQYVCLIWVSRLSSHQGIGALFS